MAKSSREKINQDEKKILGELQKNSNETIERIARRCGCSRQKVWRIIKRLEKNKTIWTYHAVVDEEKLGKKTFVILVKRSAKAVTEPILEIITKRELKKQLLKIGVEVNHSFYVHGTYDFILCATADDIRQMKLLAEIFNKTFKDHITDIEIQEVIFPLQKCGYDNPNIKEIKKILLPI